MHSPPAPRPCAENKVLAALSNTEHQHLLSQLERISFDMGEVVYREGSHIEYVYFPVTAVFSMLALMEDGDTVEVGPAGDEGMVGLSVYFGETISPTQVLVHVAGDAMRLRADVLREVLRTGSDVLPRLLLRYTQMLLAMTSQSSACNKLHSLEQQLARWLLMMHDYVGDELLLTHELIAQTLGVRRSGISEAASDFREAGLIDYQRGHIQVTDRQGLEAKACECYGVIKDEYARVYADLPKLSG